MKKELKLEDLESQIITGRESAAPKKGKHIEYIFYKDKKRTFKVESTPEGGSNG